MLHRLPKGKNEWSRALYSALANDAEKVPKDWLNSDQVADQLGVNRTQALKFLKRLRLKNLVEMTYFRVCVNDEFGLVRKVPHYRLPKKTKLTRSPQT
jgi:predicted ArsR family transcriptional regulator